jgi:hypothetical protein
MVPAPSATKVTLARRPVRTVAITSTRTANLVRICRGRMTLVYSYFSRAAFSHLQRPNDGPMVDCRDRTTLPCIWIESQ